MSTQKSYIGVAPLTMARTTAGGYVSVYAGNPVPGGVTSEDLKRLLDEGFLGEQEAPVESDTSGDSKPAKVEDILAEVGDDKTKAAAALETEKGLGDKARSTLVSKLEAIVNA